MQKLVEVFCRLVGGPGVALDVGEAVTSPNRVVDVDEAGIPIPRVLVELGMGPRPRKLGKRHLVVGGGPVFRIAVDGGGTDRAVLLEQPVQRRGPWPALQQIMLG